MRNIHALEADSRLANIIPVPMAHTVATDANDKNLAMFPVILKAITFDRLAVDVLLVIGS